MEDSGGQQPGQSSQSIGGLIEAGDPVDSVKLEEWLEGADKEQCHWMANYLLTKLGGHSVDSRLRDASAKTYADLVRWLMTGVGYHFADIPFSEVDGIRRQGTILFDKARNAWNQKVNRRRKAEKAANTISLDATRKKQLRKLASEQGLSDEEFLSNVIDLMTERRSAVEGLLKQRKEVKRAAIALDLGLAPFPEPGDDGGGAAGYNGA